MVPPYSHRVYIPWYSGFCWLLSVFRLRDFHPLWSAFPKPLGYTYRRLLQSSTPPDCSGGLGSSHFARRYSGNRFFFLLLPLLRCFSSRRFPAYGYGFTIRCPRFARAGCPIRISAGRRIFAPNRSFSQLVTSFFGSRCQGIHLMLLLA